MGCRQRGFGGVALGSKRPSRDLESQLLPLCVCGPGPAGGDPVEAAGQGKGLSGPPSVVSCCCCGAYRLYPGAQGLGCGWEPPE